MNFTPFFFLRNFVRSLQNMKIVVILVFTLLCAYCSGDSSHSVCVCWSGKAPSANKPTRDELDLSSLSTSFCCYDFEDVNSMFKGMARGVERHSICNMNSGYADQFKKCCSEKWGLEVKCT